MNNYLLNQLPQFNNIQAGNTFLPRTEITEVNGRPGAEKRLSLMPPDSSDLFLKGHMAIYLDDSALDVLRNLGHKIWVDVDTWRPGASL